MMPPLTRSLAISYNIEKTTKLSPSRTVSRNLAYIANCKVSKAARNSATSADATPAMHLHKPAKKYEKRFLAKQFRLSFRVVKECLASEKN